MKHGWNNQWNKYIAWFDARIQRERAILAVAVIGCILMLGVDHWVWPAFAKSHQLSTESVQSAQTVADMQAQTDRLQLQLLFAALDQPTVCAVAPALSLPPHRDWRAVVG